MVLMIFLPLSWGFHLVLVLSLMLACVSSNWFGLWASLELNMMAFLPLLTASGSVFQLENSVKYFLVQAVASLWFFFSLTLASLFTVSGAMMVAALAMVVKLGLAPCHTWFFSVMTTSTWGGLLLLTTVQKFIPLVILSRVTSSPLLIFSVVSITAAVTITGGLGQTAIRKVMTYSSLNNVSWMVMSETMSGYTWALYFASYCVLMVPLVVAIVALGGGYSDQLMAGSAPRQNVALVLFGLFSLGGLPPLLGFFNKLLIVKLLVAGEGLILLLTVVLSSLALLYFYTNLAFYTLSCGPESTLPSNKSAHSAVAKALAGGPILSVFIFCGAGGA